MTRLVLQLLCLLCTVPLGGMELNLRGHLRGQGTRAHYDHDHFITLSGKDTPYLDAASNFRLVGRLAFDSPLTFRVDYEAGIQGGDTRNSLIPLLGTFPDNAFGLLTPPSDKARLIDLTMTSGENDDWIRYHRLDRLLLSWQGDRASIHFGRQALSWGNGLIFNPADLLNPFAPTDVIRDYKMGTDMLLFQTYCAGIDDWQVVLVPRRDPVSRDLQAEESSFATKIRWSAANAEWDLMFARHYDATVVGFGVSGYLGGAVWRSDVLYTFLETDADRSGYISAVMNIDYTWMLAGKNWYGSVEIFYNGIGESDPRDVFSNLPLSRRISRGEVFTTGKVYMSWQLRYEHHPLVNMYLSVIQNLSDGSLVLQPRLGWDARENLQILAGVDLPVGGRDTEFGGIVDPTSGTTNAPSVRAYTVATWYF